MSFDGKWIGVRCFFYRRNTKLRVMGEGILVIGYSLLGKRKRSLPPSSGVNEQVKSLVERSFY
jgi:hypothetical protein